jgi:phosphatidylethanolamine/phosphatidyl-N-methylethanolamine N-methyltransferase
MDAWVTFFQEFLRHPRQVGSVVPSSRFLERRIVEAAGVRSARTVVELGPGTGGTTRAILRAIGPDARLLTIELNPHLYTLVSRIEDQRHIAHLGDARALKEIISTHALGAPDAVISGIPFSTIGPQTGCEILETIHSVLAPGGRFVAYQVKRQVAALSPLFPEPDDAELELFNIPPLRIFRWEKDGVRP